VRLGGGWLRRPIVRDFWRAVLALRYGVVEVT
jgi:hypothetical protein